MDNQNSEWTILIPFFSAVSGEAEIFLKKTIQSVLQQTVTDWSLIVVDDCSPIGGIKDLVDSFEDSRISYFRNSSNKGQAGNWNICMQLNKSPYFTILHADDCLSPSYGQTMLNIIKTQKHVSGVFCQADIINENDSNIFSFADLYKTFLMPSYDFEVRGDSGLASLIRGNYIMCPTMLYRADRMTNLLFNEKDFQLMPDLCMWSDMLLKDHILWGTPRKLFRYRRHSASGTAVGRKGLKMFEDEKRLLMLLGQRAKDKNWPESASLGTKYKIAKKRALFFGVKELVSGHFKAGAEKIGFGLFG